MYNNKRTQAFNKFKKILNITHAKKFKFIKHFRGTLKTMRVDSKTKREKYSNHTILLDNFNNSERRSKT